MVCFSQYDIMVLNSHCYIWKVGSNFSFSLHMDKTTCQATCNVRFSHYKVLC